MPQEEGKTQVFACKAKDERLRMVAVRADGQTTLWDELSREKDGSWRAVSTGRVEGVKDMGQFVSELLESPGHPIEVQEVKGWMADDALGADAERQGWALSWLLDAMDPAVRDPDLAKEMPLGLTPPAELLEYDAIVRATRSVAEAAERGQARSEAVGLRLSGRLEVEVAGLGEDGGAPYVARATAAVDDEEMLLYATPDGAGSDEPVIREDARIAASDLTSTLFPILYGLESLRDQAELSREEEREESSREARDAREEPARSSAPRRL
jgi:hypothetical protein